MSCRKNVMFVWWNVFLECGEKWYTVDSMCLGMHARFPITSGFILMLVVLQPALSSFADLILNFGNS